MTTLREAARQALERVQEFKRRWLLVPAFGNKVSKATREAITSAHSPIFDLEYALRAALAQPQRPPVTKGLPRKLPEDNDHGDWDRVSALEASLREHMAEIHRLRAALAQQAEPTGFRCELCGMTTMRERDGE